MHKTSLKSSTVLDLLLDITYKGNAREFFMFIFKVLKQALMPCLYAKASKDQSKLAKKP